MKDHQGKKMFHLLLIIFLCSTKCSNIWGSMSTNTPNYNSNTNYNSRSRSSHNEIINSRIASIPALQLEEPYILGPSGQQNTHQPPRTSRFHSSPDSSFNSAPGAYRVTNLLAHPSRSAFQNTALLATSTAIIIPQANAEPVEFYEENPESPDLNSISMSDNSDDDRIPGIYLNNYRYNQFSVPDSLDRLVHGRTNRRK